MDDKDLKIRLQKIIIDDLKMVVDMQRAYIENADRLARMERRAALMSETTPPTKAKKDKRNIIPLWQK